MEAEKLILQNWEGSILEWCPVGNGDTGGGLAFARTTETVTWKQGHYTDTGLGRGEGMEAELVEVLFWSLLLSQQNTDQGHQWLKLKFLFLALHWYLSQTPPHTVQHTLTSHFPNLLQPLRLPVSPSKLVLLLAIDVAAEGVMINTWFHQNTGYLSLIHQYKTWKYIVLGMWYP